MTSGRQAALFLRLSRPHFLLGGVLAYGLGVSIARYLGRPIDPERLVLGLGLALSVQSLALYLNEYYDSRSDAGNPTRTAFSGGTGVLGEAGLPRRAALYASVVALAIAAILASILLRSGQTAPLAWVLITLGTLTAFFYSAPPLRLVESGYGELAASIALAGVVPYFAFALQTGEVHRLLFMSTVPLVAIHFAMMIAFSLPDFGNDLRVGKQTLMVRIGWSAAMRLHDAALLLAGGSLVFAFLSGMPRGVALGTAISLPLAAAQAWQLVRIRRGYPPRWTTLTLGAAGLFALTTYLELAGYLLR